MKYTQVHLADMRRFFNTVSPVVAGLLLTVVLLLGLAYPAEAGPKHQEIDASQTPITDSITITLWYAYAAGSAEEAALSRVYMKGSFTATDSTGKPIELNLVRERLDFNKIFPLYQSAVLSGSGPDLLLAPNDNLGDQARAGVVKDISAYLGRLDKVQATAIDGMKVNGKLYGVPESAKAVGLFYNTASFPAPLTISTTDQLLDLVKSGKKLALVDGVNDGSAYYNYGWFGAFGGQLFDASGRCIADKGGFTPAMQYLIDLKTAGALVRSTPAEVADLFKKGDVDMVIDGPWMLKEYKNVLNIGIIPLPSSSAGSAKPLLGIDGFYVNPNSKYANLVTEFALYLTNQVNSGIFFGEAGHVPIRSDVSPGNDTEIQALLDIAAISIPRPQTTQFSNYWSIFGQMVYDVLEGKMEPASGVKMATDHLNAANGITTTATINIYLPLVVK